MERLYALCSKSALLYYKVFYKLEIIGLENVNLSQNYIVCANHLSLHDPFLLGAVIPFQARFMSKKENFKYKIVGWFLRKVGVFPVDREGNDIKAMKIALGALKKKESLALFPEGTRNKGFDPLPVKGGVAMFAIRTQTPILPITIDSHFRRFGKIRVVFHKPFELSAYYEQKMESDELENLSQKIIEDIYKAIVLHKPEQLLK